MPNTEVTYFEDKFYMDGAFSAKRKFSHSTAKHTHDFIEIVYVIKGKGTHVVDGRSYPTSSGDLLFINYNSIHSVRSETGVSYVDIYLKPAFIDESLRGAETAFALLSLPDFKSFESAVNNHNCLLHFESEERQQIENLILWAAKENTHQTAGSSLILSSFMNLFLTVVFRKMALPLSETRNLDEGLLVYIREHCGDRLTLSDLSARCGYCNEYFSRLFKRYTGVTFSAYLAGCRMEKATSMLTSSDLPVEDIITACGFTDRTRFFRVFAEHTGTTPSKFRKKSK